MKKLFVLDVDETVTENGKLFDKNIIKQIIKIHKSEDKEIILNSARNYSNLISRLNGYSKLKIVARNGSIIYDENGKIIFCNYLSENEIIKFISFCNNNNLHCCLIMFENNSERLFTTYDNRDFFKNFEYDIFYLHDFSNINLKRIITAYCFGDVSNICLDALNNCNIIKNENFIQILSKFANKGNALKWLIDNYSYDKIIGFGNDKNDFSFLNICNDAYFVYKKSIFSKYKKIKFDNGKTVLSIIEKE